MRDVALLTSPGCHLCAHSRDVLDALADDGLIHWSEISTESDEGRGLVDAGAPPMRPVLYDHDRRVIAYGRLSERRLRKAFR